MSTLSRTSLAPLRFFGRRPRAATILWAPTIGLGLARSRAALGKLLGAQEAYSRVSTARVTPDASEAFKQAIQDATRELEALKPRVPTLVITVRGSTSSEVTLDGLRIAPVSLGVPRPVDPGLHVVRATSPGFVPTETTMTLAERANQSVVLDLKPGDDTLGAVPSPPPATRGAALISVPAGQSSKWATQKTVAVAVGGAGVVGFVLAGVFAAQATSKNNASTGHCLVTNPNLCDPQGLSLRGDAASAADVTTTAVIAGGMAAAAGVVLWLTAPSSVATGGGHIGILPAAVGADVGLGLCGSW